MSREFAVLHCFFLGNSLSRNSQAVPITYLLMHLKKGPMKSSKFLFALTAFAIAASSHAGTGPTPTPGPGPGPVLLSEGFDNISTLNSSGWEFVNVSTPVGNSWFQGNSGVFAAHSGADNSYIGANYLSSKLGSGTVDNWLLSPVLTLSTQSKLSFFARTETAGFTDKLEVRFVSGNSNDVAQYTTLVTTVGANGDFPDAGFTNFVANLPVTGAGRFAFRYTSDATTANYIGIDTVSVTAVPEPSTYAMMGLGLAALALVRRKAKKA